MGVSSPQLDRRDKSCDKITGARSSCWSPVLAVFTLVCEDVNDPNDHKALPRILCQTKQDQLRASPGVTNDSDYSTKHCRTTSSRQRGSGKKVAHTMASDLNEMVPGSFQITTHGKRTTTMGRRLGSNRKSFARKSFWTRVKTSTRHEGLFEAVRARKGRQIMTTLDKV
jgi:hypothetical protein